jgi:O-antigen/teichoic acid export membrane protein
MGLIFVPFYIRIMGIESYGLVGFYTMLIFMSNYVFDFGLSMTVNRELARYSTESGKSNNARDLVRTLEVIYILIGLLVGGLACIGAPFIANNWIKPQNLPLVVVQQSVFLIGIVVTVQWPISFYQGGLLGLQKQVQVNIINVVMSTVRSGGAVLVLWLVSPTIIAFFTWQVVASAIQVFLSAMFLWRSLPTGIHPPRFEWGLLKSIWRFATGLTATSLVTFSLSQLDKIILSGMLSLEMFGYYNLASTLGNVLRMIINPIAIALFPRFSALVKQGDHESLKVLYHKGCQLVSVLIFPIAIATSLFSFELLWLWTGSEDIANITATILSFLVIGTGLNALVSLPYDLQISYGWTKLGFYKNLLATIIMIPLTIVLAKRYGAVGAAFGWIVLNGGYFIFELPIMHSRLLKNELRRWYLQDISRPLIPTLLVVGLGRWLTPQRLTPLATGATMVFIALIALFVSTVSTPYLRDWSLGQIVKFRSIIWS